VRVSGFPVTLSGFRGPFSALPRLGGAPGSRRKEYLRSSDPLRGPIRLGASFSGSSRAPGHECPRALHRVRSAASLRCRAETANRVRDGVHPEGWSWRTPCSCGQMLRCARGPTPTSSLRPWPPRRTSAKRCSGNPASRRSCLRWGRGMRPPAVLKHGAVGRVNMPFRAGCRFRRRCDTPLPGWRTGERWAGRPAPGPCSADESVTSHPRFRGRTSCPSMGFVPLQGPPSSAAGAAAGPRSGRARAPPSPVSRCARHPSAGSPFPSAIARLGSRRRPSLSGRGVVIAAGFVPKDSARPFD
jgi:hypothetical protein